MKTMKRSVVVKGCGGQERMNKWRTENFGGSENTLHDTILMDICDYTFVQIHTVYNSKSELECKLWTSLLMNDISI